MPKNPDPLSQPLLPLVYVAGPISTPNPVTNTHKALVLGTRLRDTGLLVPFIPHALISWELACPADYETFMAYDFQIIRHAQAVFRMVGQSPGADRECHLAQKLGLPVFHAEQHLLVWAKDWIRKNNLEEVGE